ncbi:winged helix-turn-helix domain-containing protein [Echinimonas agarilytica]|uniref:Winged helix-turn-helix domain-containing protein n=1 Tax=Echinimonas agarilytica TaxID=1215918 RepID=A0AA41W8I6_9GAMM|nr:winged helix-turn-helix domain-containing protein [Echinimonas agarilytica]MCM2680945.1 winged helix-turn-helix domain-containing protein [Echinimonas agarilytica]
MQFDPNASFFLEQVEIKPDSGEIIRRGISSQIEPKVMAVLLYLVQHPYQVLSHEELIEKVWEGVVVTPRSVRRSIAVLRHALDPEDAEHYIKTHPKRGYQLLISPKPRHTSNVPKIAALTLLVLSLVAAAMYGLFADSQTFGHPLQHVNTLKGYALSPLTEELAYIKQDHDSLEVWLAPQHTKLMVLPEGATSPLIAWSPNDDNIALLWQEQEKSVLATYNIRQQQLSYRFSDTQFSYTKLSFWGDQHLLLIRNPLHQVDPRLVQYDLHSNLSSVWLPNTKIHTASATAEQVAVVIKDGKHKRIKLLASNQQTLIFSHVQTDFIDDILLMPNAQGLVYSSREGLHFNDLAGTTAIIPWPGDQKGLTLQYDTQHQEIYVLTQRIQKQRWLHSSQENLRRKLSLSGHTPEQVTLSHTGQQLAYVASEDAISQLWFSDTINSHPVTQFSETKPISNVSWSAQDDWLIFSSGPSSYGYDMASQQLHLLMEPNLYTHPVCILSGGKGFYFLDESGFFTTLKHGEISTSSPPQVIQHIASAEYICSADRLFAVSQQESALYQLNGDQWQLIDSDFPTPIKLLAGSDNAIYYFVALINQRNTIWRYDLNHKTHTQLIKRSDYSGVFAAIASNENFVVEQKTATGTALRKYNKPK